MSPIYARSPMKPQNKLRGLTAALAVGLYLVSVGAVEAAPRKTTPSAAAAQQLEGVVEVSEFEFNTFVFAAPVKQLIFPVGAPVKGEPVYLSGNTQVMLEFPKSDKVIQFVAELGNDTVVSLRVKPKSIPGVSHSVNGARPKAAAPSKKAPAADARLPQSPRGEDIELLKFLMANHQAPEHFEPVSLPASVRFDKFSVIPLASWSDGTSKRIHIFSLVAATGQTAVVAPPQFYRDGINAVMLDGDVVDDSHTPQLFVVEEMADE